MVRPSAKEGQGIYVWEDSKAGSGRQEAWRKTRRDIVDVAKGDVKLASAPTTTPPQPSCGATFCRSAFS